MQWCLINKTTGRFNTVTCPGQLNLGVRWFGADLKGSDLAGVDEKQETSNISLLTCMRHSAAPTTNVAVSEVSRPTANQK